MIHSCTFQECNAALKSVYVRLDMQSIYALVDNTPFISDIHKRFYKHILSARFLLIIKETYDLLTKDQI